MATSTAAKVPRPNINASDLKELRRAWRARSLVLFLGAGVSMPYGLPSWRSLVLELLFEQARDTRRLGRMLPHYRRAVASWMADYFSYDPLVLARMVEENLGSKRRRPDEDDPVFLKGLRTHLYANMRSPATRTTLKAIGDLIEGKGGGVESVVTFNFDDLLERELSQRGVPFVTVAGPERQRGSGLRVIHAHGHVPREGPISRLSLVFTEPDYHRLTEAVFHWALSEIVERLRKNTVLFIGLSMSDPSLRRLLDASRNSKIPPHYQIQKHHEVRDSEQAVVIQDIDQRARQQAKLLGVDEQKTQGELVDAVNDALRQADTYDREVFEGMGVKTIWVDSFEQMPLVVDAIRR